MKVLIMANIFVGLYKFCKQFLDDYRPSGAIIVLLIKRLCEKIIKIGVNTDGRPKGLRAPIVALGLECLIDGIIVTDELRKVRFRKSSDIAFRVLQKKMNVPFEQMLYVGENPKKDFVAPHALEMKSIWFKNIDGLY